MTDININDDGPLVSIIIPIYNAEKYLKECLESVISQTYDKLEIILIDDGSTDTSGTVCDEYASKDRRIRLIHKNNQGRSVARNDGLKLMTGDYFVFVDADDILVSDAIRLMVNETSEDPDIVFARMVDFFHDKELLTKAESGEAESIPYDDLLECFLLGNMHGRAYSYEIYNSPWARLYSKRIKGVRFSEDLSYAEDFLYSVMAILNCKSFRYLDKVVYRYRRFYDEENHFWEKYRNLSLEAAEAVIRSIKYVKDNEDSIYQDYLLRSYYVLLENYCGCVRLRYNESAEKIAKKLDMIKSEVRGGKAFREMKTLSRLKLSLSFISYRLYAAARAAGEKKKEAS